MLGYSDGIARPTSDQVGITHEGKYAPIIGRVSMDQFVVDLGIDSLAKAGDLVTLFGDGSVKQVDDWALAAGTINYEIVTRLAARLPRVYLN
jgi:alanine racemase